MRVRLPIALLALIGVTAFAPAPFLKPDRKRAADSELLQRMQGTWSMTGKQRMSPDGLVNYSTRQKVRVDRDAWQFVSAAEGKGFNKGKGGAPPKAKKAPGRLSFRIVLDPGGEPRPFRLKRVTTAEQDYMIGVLAFEGNKLKVLYRLVGDETDVPEQLPNNFLTIPMGWYLLTLERD